ncbi:MAG: diaminopimelate decarboxylase [Verrucomicrobiales bacterium]|jgi:diaminopimelate decarboxylase
MNPYLKELAQQFGTPSYVYDLNEAKQRAEELQSLFPAQANPRLMYSFKANPLPSLAREHCMNGCQADLTSTGEVEAAKLAGFAMDKALYGGPGKNAHEIYDALTAGIRNFSVESWHDLQEIAAAARQAEVKVRCILRINPLDPPKAKLAMAGVASQFGFEEGSLRIEDRSKLRDVEDVISVEGTHIYWGTQMSDADALTACFRSGVQAAEKVSMLLGFNLRILNLGGGFPWPYAKNGVRDLSGLKASLAEVYAECGAARDAEWWFESGRYLSSSSGTLLTRVMDIKVSKERKYVIVDTGIHHLGGMAGLGRIPRFSIDVLPLEPRGGEMTADVVGQLCTPLDCLGRNLTLPALSVGDLVAIPNVGAYGLTGSLVGFLSRPAPREIAFRGTYVVSVHQFNTGHSPVLVSNFETQSTSQQPNHGNDNRHHPDTGNPCAATSETVEERRPA